MGKTTAHSYFLTARQAKNRGKRFIRNGIAMASMLMFSVAGEAMASPSPDRTTADSPHSTALRKTDAPIPRLPVADSKRLAFYENKLFIVDNNGILWETEQLDGQNEDGKNHTPSSFPNPPAPPAKTITARPVDRHIIMVSAGSHVYILDDSGTLWERQETGSPDQPATPGKNPRASVRNAVRILDNVRDVTADSLPQFAIRNDNTLWTWGASDEKRTDYFRHPLSRPRKILDHVREIVDSHYHILALKEDGTLWSWGNNMCGGLGNGTSGTVQTRPRPIDMRRFKGKRIISMTAHKQENYILTEDNTIWYWGEDNNDKPYCFGESPTIPTASSYKIPHPVKRLFYMRKGWTNDLYALGPDGTFYRLEDIQPSSDTDDDNRSTSYLHSTIEPLLKDVDHYATDRYTSAFMLKDGTVWIQTGYDDHDSLYRIVFAPEQ